LEERLQALHTTTVIDDMDLPAMALKLFKVFGPIPRKSLAELEMEQQHWAGGFCLDMCISVHV
jgi:hypothetical protein